MVATWETQRLIPSTVLLERIPSAAHTYIAEQGLNPNLLYAGCDVAEAGAHPHCWKQEQTLPLVCSQTDRKQGRLYGFYKPFLKKVGSVRIESGPKFRLGQRDSSFHILQLAYLGGKWKMVDVNTFSYRCLCF